MDLEIIEGLQALRTPFWDSFFSFVTDFGAMLGFVVAFALLYWLYDKKYGLNFAVTYCAVSVVNSVVFKNIFRRPRPLKVSNKYPPYSGYPTSYSFPSGHSASVATIAGYNIYEADKYRKSSKDNRLFIAALVVGIFLCVQTMFSRMYLGVHYLTDVLVGAALGFGISYVFFRFVNIKSMKFYRWLLLAEPVYLVLLIVLSSSKISVMGSLFMSIVAGVNIEDRFIQYDYKKYKNVWIKLLIGVPIIALDFVLVLCTGSVNKYILALKYWSMGLVITCLVPYILSKLKGRNKMISKSENDTLKLGKKVSKQMKGGEVILLNGDLGCGKTVFAKGFAEGTGVKEPVTSPTFTIVNKYSGKFTMYHFDMYRLEDEEEAMAAGLDELIDEKGAVKLIEWSEKVPNLLPKDCIVVDIKKIDDNTREIQIKGLN